MFSDKISVKTSVIGGLGPSKSGSDQETAPAVELPFCVYRTHGFPKPLGASAALGGRCKQHFWMWNMSDYSRTRAFILHRAALSPNTWIRKGQKHRKGKKEAKKEESAWCLRPHSKWADGGWCSVQEQKELILWKWNVVLSLDLQ